MQNSSNKPYRQLQYGQYNNCSVKQEKNRSRNKHNHNHKQTYYLDSTQQKNKSNAFKDIKLIEIKKPKIFKLFEINQPNYQLNNQKQQLQFKIQMQVSKDPPQKKEPYSSKISQLKNQITSVQSIWKKCVKQYLNDSQFVQIYRKNNYLCANQLRYGKTIINYDGLANKQTYNNSLTQTNIFSRAYFKLWQILNLRIFDSVQFNEVSIACLAEGPGGFLHALIDYRLKQNPKIKDKYYAITLKVNQLQQQLKVGPGSDWQNQKSSHFFKIIRNEGYDLKLSYGQDKAGNLLNLNNIKYFQIDVLMNQKVFLVTGDGGIQCSTDNQFHYQQVTNSKLFFAEILTALKIQQLKGIFILKIYDCHFDITKQLIVLLACFYDVIQAIKPVTSRPGNSQKYLKCTAFKGISNQQLVQLQKLFCQWNILQSEFQYFKNHKFVVSLIKFQNTQFQNIIKQNIEIMNQILCKEQQTKIQEGLRIIEQNGKDIEAIRYKMRDRIKNQINYAYSWCVYYGLPTIIKPLDLTKKQNKTVTNRIQDQFIKQEIPK